MDRDSEGRENNFITFVDLRSNYKCYDFKNSHYDKRVLFALSTPFLPPNSVFTLDFNITKL